MPASEAGGKEEEERRRRRRRREPEEHGRGDRNAPQPTADRPRDAVVVLARRIARVDGEDSIPEDLLANSNPTHDDTKAKQSQTQNEHLVR